MIGKAFTWLILVLPFKASLAAQLNGAQKAVAHASLTPSREIPTVVHSKDPGGDYRDESQVFGRAGWQATDDASDQMTGTATDGATAAGEATGQAIGDASGAGARSTHRARSPTRNYRIFFLIIGLAFVVLAFAVRGYLDRGKPPAPVPEPLPKQSTFMSEMFPHTANRWEKRGVISGIVMSLTLLSSVATMALAMHPIYMHLSAWTKCEEGGAAGLYWWESKFCAYTAAYIWTAPMIALAAVLLLFARGILQYRFYYGLLKAGAVLDYHRSTATGDPFFLIFLWWYAHSIMYLGYLGLIIGQGASGILEAQIKKMVLLLAYAIIPFTLFIFFFHSKYTLEQTLVPLSEICDAEESRTGKKSFLDGLFVINESVAREVLESSANSGSSPLSQQATDEAKYLSTVRLCRERMQNTPPGSLKPSDLWNYLWPSTVLLSSKTLGDNAKLFRKFWWIYAVVAMLALVVSGGGLLFCAFLALSKGQYMFLPACCIAAVVLGMTFQTFRKASLPR